MQPTPMDTGVIDLVLHRDVSRVAQNWGDVVKLSVVCFPTGHGRNI